MPFARVLVDQSGGKALDYAIPPELEGKVQVGSRVAVSVRRRSATATVIELPETSDVPGIRPLERLLTPRPVLTPRLLRLARWMAGYYCCPLEVAMRAVLPQVVRKGKVGFKQQLAARLVRPLAPEWLAELTRRAPKQAAIVEILAEATPPVMLIAPLLKTAGSDRGALTALVSKGIVSTHAETVERDPHEGETFVASAPHPLNEEQGAVFARVCAALEEREPKPILLHGVTGSGKTEIYLQGIERVLARGQSAIMLVPEIALTPQTVERFRSRFAAIGVAVLHSHLSEGERHDEWHKINDGRARIVIGARSAVFAPLENLGLIVVDEEHENSYKQEEAPRYHARDLAVLRGHFEGCAVVLGSATPSLESYHNARSGKYELLSMRLRVDDRKMPYFRIIDMRLESRRNKGGPSVISEKMRQGIEARLARREQSILFLNRRGFSTALSCDACGYVAQCPNCSLSLTFHRAENRIVCHLCGHHALAPAKCPDCKDPGIKYTGIGTEKVEEIVVKMFPKAVVRRMDADTMTRKEAYRETLTAFRTGKIDILLGTQMIAKGLHFPNVTLVGIINADMGLHLPDFRAGERVFQLLTQVAGRAGRGDVEGEVFVQSFTPHHPAIQYARHHDYDGFAEQEIEWRQQWDYPPFTRMVLVTTRSPHQELGRFTLETLARRIAEAKAEFPGDTIFGEATPAPLEKSHGSYRHHLSLRARSIGRLCTALQAVLARLTLPEEVVLTVDVDPYQLL